MEDCVLLELKALEQTGRIHGRQVLTYLRLTGLPLGLLLNFGAKRMADGVERIVNNFPCGTEPIGRRSDGAGSQNQLRANSRGVASDIDSVTSR